MTEMDEEKLKEQEKSQPEHKEAQHGHKEHHAENKPEKKKTALYKKLLIIPFILLILAIAQISYQVATTGDFVKKDYTLTGGIEITLQTNQTINTDELKTELNKKFSSVDEVRSLTQSGEKTGIIITDSNIEDGKPIREYLKEKFSAEENSVSVKSVGPSLAAGFFKQTLIAVICAFVFMSIVVFISFRVPVPSLAVILSAFCDIVMTLAIFNITGQKLSTAGVAAFLMLIGYSVDTDILLSARVLKRAEGTVKERTMGAMKTGMIMMASAIAVALSAFILSQSAVIKQIMLIILIGLCVDIINTWIQNAGILRWYMEKKHHE